MIYTVGKDGGTLNKLLHSLCCASSKPTKNISPSGSRFTLQKFLMLTYTATFTQFDKIVVLFFFKISMQRNFFHGFKIY